MAEFETEHPLGQSMEKIHKALAGGLTYGDTLIGDDIEMTFLDADISDSGISSHVIASWVTKNQTLIEFPIRVPNGEEQWTARIDGEDEPVLQKIVIRDLVGRCFPILDERERDILSTPFLAFRVTGTGIMFDATPGGYIVESSFGRYESERYDSHLEMARTQGSIDTLEVLSDRFLSL